MGTEMQQGREIEKTEKRQSPVPEMPKPIRNRAWAWGAGALLALVLLAGILFPAIPVLGAVAALFAGLGGLGIAIGLMAAFLLPRTLFAAKGVGQTVEVAKSFGMTFVKAVLWGGGTFAFGFFLMPLLMPMLAGLTGLGFLTTFGGTGLVSTIMTALSATFTFFKTMYKGDFMPTLLANKARAAEMFIGVGVILLGGLALAGGGILPFALPLAVPIVALFVGFALALGVITNVRDYLANRPASAEKGTEMANLAKQEPGAIPVPDGAPRKAAGLAADASVASVDPVKPVSGLPSAFTAGRSGAAVDPTASQPGSAPAA